MASTSTLGLTFLTAGQAGAEILVNLNSIICDVVLAGTQVTEATAPPGSPVNGDVRRVVAPATGVFAGKEGKLAIYWDGTWYFRPESGNFPFPKQWSTLETPLGFQRDGSPVYSKVIDLGQGPSTAPYIKAVNHNITGLLLTKPIHLVCAASDGTSIFPGPMYHESSVYLGYNLVVTSTQIVWQANFDMSGFSMKVRMEYCK